MTDEQKRILCENNELLHENNAMLKEIIDYVRERRSSEYRNSEDMKQFCINVVADVLVDGMEEDAKNGIRGGLKHKS